VSRVKCGHMYQETLGFHKLQLFTVVGFSLSESKALDSWIECFGFRLYVPICCGRFLVVWGKTTCYVLTSDS
jgi:hypothetical protein